MKSRATRVHVLISALGVISIAALDSTHFVVPAAMERQEDEPLEGRSGESRSVWDGIYTAEQAKTGESMYLEECARCHSATLTGGEFGPPLVGDAFIGGWNGLSAGDLFERIRTSMPQDSPGRLTVQQTSDILSYILQANDFPAGQTGLETALATLKMIKIDAKPPGQQP